MQKEIKWLLKENYNWTDADFILNKRSPSPIEMSDIARIEQGEPVAYVIGKTEFLECTIDLSLKPLIPRPETEYWVGSVLGSDPLRGSDPYTKILDLCCGSGCIGIAILKRFPKAHVDFVDIDSNALKQTEINLKLNQISIRDDPFQGSSLIRSNLFSNLKGKKYDFIFCNPPYVNSNGEFDENLKFEPKTALFAKDNGMFFIKKILKEFTDYLKPNGTLFLEFGSEQKDLIQAIQNNCVFYKDQYDRWRYLTVSGNKED